jgi:hypothetical protein
VLQTLDRATAAGGAVRRLHSCELQPLVRPGASLLASAAQWTLQDCRMCREWCHQAMEG